MIVKNQIHFTHTITMELFCELFSYLWGGRGPINLVKHKSWKCYSNQHTYIYLLFLSLLFFSIFFLLSSRRYLNEFILFISIKLFLIFSVHGGSSLLSFKGLSFLLCRERVFYMYFFCSEGDGCFFTTIKSR